MSRAPRAGEAAGKFTIRATRSERESWVLATKHEKCFTLSAWIIKTLNARAARIGKRKRDR